MLSVKGKIESSGRDIVHGTMLKVLLFSMLLLQGPPVTPPAEVRMTIQTTDGKTLTGKVLGEGFTDLQLLTDDQRVTLLRKTADPKKYRVVTSQKDWPTYHGDANGNHYTTVTQINKSNVSRLGPRWTFQLPGVTQQVQTTPVVIDGLMYVTSANEIWALDAGSGRQVWHWRRPRTTGITGNAAIGFNRGVAASGNRVFMLTDNAHMLAFDRFNGEMLWETEMADWKQGYNGTAAPLAVGNLVISGTAGGDEGVRGFIAAYDTATGKEAWRVWTVPNPGEPGSETWQGKLTEHRGGASWMPGTYDPQLDLLYWPTGNPGSDYNGDERKGDNLYTDSVLAIEPKTGKVRWYFQFTPHDLHDWDAQEPPVLVDTQWQGQPRKLLIQANRNGFFYVLDRVSGQFLLGKQFLKKLNWAKGLDAKGRPILNDLQPNERGETYVCPGFQGGANWYSTSFNPGTGLYYFSALERCNVFTKRTQEWQAGRGFSGGSASPAPGESYVKSLRAIDIKTGEVAWDLPGVTMPATSSGGVLSTATGLVFFCENSGSLLAVDGSNGKVLWDFPTSQTWKASPMSYVFDNKQYVAIAVGTSIMALGLPE
jgi:alcohol dehydrogenase (cytochrome c)